MGVGALIGAVVGGVAYALAHPCPDYWHSPEFWQAVGVGAFSGGVAGAVGWLVPTLLPAATSFWGAVGIGALSGSAAGGAGQITTNLLMGKPWYQGVPQAMVTGGFIGGVAGGAGYGIQQWMVGRAAASTPNAVGRAGEEAAGITGQKIQIESLTGTADFRVPDQVDRAARVVREVKNVVRLSYTSQLRDYALWAQQEGYAFELTVRQTTRLSRPLQEAIERGEIILRYLPW